MRKRTYTYPGHWARAALLSATVAIAALASCSAPFTSASPCGNEGRDCAITSNNVNEAGVPAGGDTAGTLADMVNLGGNGPDPGGSSGSGSATAAAGQGSDAAGAAGEGMPTLPKSCQAALERDPSLADGDVNIDPDGSGPVQPFDAHCDMVSDGGGWTEIGVGEYWQQNDIHLGADSVLPWVELSALLKVSSHMFRAGDGDHRLYLKDEGALVEKLNDPLGTNSTQAFIWRSTASSLQCAKSYAALATDSMLTVNTKEISCEPLGFGKHSCGVAAGWLLFHRNDTTNWSGQNPCAFAITAGGTAVAPTNGALRPLWLR